MKIDAALLVHDLNQMPAVTRFADDAEFDGIWTFETSHEPFLPLVLAAEHSSRMSLGTSIAVAFARRPTILAQIAWDLARFSGGRFILGLGTQVKVTTSAASASSGKARGKNARGDPRREIDLGMLAESNQTQFSTRVFQAYTDDSVFQPGTPRVSSNSYLRRRGESTHVPARRRIVRRFSRPSAAQCAIAKRESAAEHRDRADAKRAATPIDRNIEQYLRHSDRQYGRGEIRIRDSRADFILCEHAAVPAGFRS